jgi:hypothetical protein
LLGSKRNYLIVKDDVGKSKPSTRDLPDFKFSYGRPDQGNREGAGQVCTSWKVHVPNHGGHENNPRNFKTLNKRAVIGGATTAVDNREFRKTHDARIHFGIDALHKRGVSLPSEEFRYGRSNRP